MLAIVLGTAGCIEPEQLSHAEVEEAVLHARGQQPERLIARVGELVAAHLTEEGTVYDPWDGPHRRIKAGEWVFQEFVELGYAPVFEEGERNGYPVANVIAEIPGLKKPEEKVIVSAHHDVWYAGADDNSSGVVALLAAAAALQHAGPDRTIRFVSMDQEEPDDFNGSRLHYERLDPEAIHAVINADTIAYAAHEPNTQTDPFGVQWPDVADFVAVLGNESSDHLVRWSLQLGPKLEHPVRVVGMFGIGNNEGELLSGLGRSDHVPAWELGLPAVMITDTTESRNERYHTERDTPDTLDPNFFAGTTELIIALTWAAQGVR